MTKEQIKKRTEEKLKEVQELYIKLQLTVSAEEIVDKSGMIKKVVYYIDTEKYEIEND